MGKWHLTKENRPANLAMIPVVDLLVPDSKEDVASIMNDAAANDLAFYPFGGSTWLDFGCKPVKPGHALDMRSINKVIEYPSEDMTITVELGMTIDHLARVLAEKNQRLPIDVGCPARSTIGGAIALDMYGPRSYGFGRLRDYVLGIDFVDASGQIVHGGGRVVKNVAGYDLMKLQIGAMGTLGILVQATLKVLPAAESRAVIGVPISAEHLEPLLAKINFSATRPVGVSVLNRNAAESLPSLWDLRDHGRTVLIFFEESRMAVEWQVKVILDEIRSLGHFARPLPHDMYESCLQQLTDWPLLTPSGICWCARLLPGDVAEFMSLVETTSPNTGNIAHANGTIWGSCDVALERDLHAMIARLRDWVVCRQGSLVVWRCPAEWKSHSLLFGTETQQWQHSQRLKHTLDPQGRFNPGRFL